MLLEEGRLPIKTAIFNSPIAEFDRQLLSELKNTILLWKSGSKVAASADYDEAIELINKLHIPEHKKGSMAREILDLRNSLLSEASARVADVDRLQGEISELKTENAELRRDNAELKEDIVEMKKRQAEFFAREEYSRYLIALQDLNTEYQLEKTISPDFNTNFNTLRSKRNSESHFILKEDNKNLKVYKAVSIRDRLDTMSPECAVKFTKKFGPSFLNAVKTYISTSIVLTGTVSEKDKKAADEWWDDY
jgi:predicted nuclease with TOPRIM domain